MREENHKAELVAFIEPQMTAPVNTEFSLVCGATGRPLPVITWTYQGIQLVSVTPDSKELNFEFFELLGGQPANPAKGIPNANGNIFFSVAHILQFSTIFKKIQ